MALKGQNLRIFVDDKCVAAAQSMNLNISADTQETTSKDSTGAWSEYECTGLKWDASVDALVVSDKIVVTDNDFTLPISTDVGTAYCCPHDFILDSGDTFYFRGKGYHVCLYEKRTNNTWLEVKEINMSIDWVSESYLNVSLGKKTLRIGSTSPDPTNAIEFTDDGERMVDLLNNIKGSNTPVAVKFARTNGYKNRTAGTVLCEGTALITKLSVNAQVKNNSTFSCELVGVGELETQSSVASAPRMAARPSVHEDEPDSNDSENDSEE